MEASTGPTEDDATADGQELHDLEDLLDLLGETAQDADEVSVDMIMESVGRRSFGPLLLVAGLVAISPIGDIPGGPSVIGMMLLFVAVQLLMGRDEFWLPGWLMRRKVSGERFRKALDWSRKPAGFIDRFLRPRLTFLTRSAGAHGIAAVCAVIAVAMVPMELVPFSITGAALTLIALGLSLVAHDGLLAVVAFCVFGATSGLVLYHLL